MVMMITAMRIPAIVGSRVELELVDDDEALAADDITIKITHVSLDYLYY